MSENNVSQLASGISDFTVGIANALGLTRRARINDLLIENQQLENRFRRMQLEQAERDAELQRMQVNRDLERVRMENKAAQIAMELSGISNLATESEKNTYLQQLSPKLDRLGVQRADFVINNLQKVPLDRLQSFIFNLSELNDDQFRVAAISELARDPSLNRIINLTQELDRINRARRANFFGLLTTDLSNLGNMPLEKQIGILDEEIIRLTDLRNITSDPDERKNIQDSINTLEGMRRNIDPIGQVGEAFSLQNFSPEIQQRIRDTIVEFSPNRLLGKDEAGNIITLSTRGNVINRVPIEKQRVSDMVGISQPQQQQFLPAEPPQSQGLPNQLPITPNIIKNELRPIINKELSEGDTEKIEILIDILRSIKRVRRFAETRPDFIGIFDALIMNLRNLTGIGASREFGQFIASLSQMRDLLFTKGGKALTSTELKQLGGQFPSHLRSEKDFLGRSDVFEDALVNKILGQLEILKDVKNIRNIELLKQKINELSDISTFKRANDDIFNNNIQPIDNNAIQRAIDDIIRDPGAFGITSGMSKEDVQQIIMNRARQLQTQ